MHYLVTVGYESERLDRNGNPRLQKFKYIVEADSVEEASIVIAHYTAEDTRSSESISISKMAIEDVIDRTKNPLYYKSKF